MHALITGVSSGIGAGIAAYLYHAGWTISGIDHKPPHDTYINYHSVDLSQLDQVEEFRKNHIEDYDALIHCAGIREICDPCELTLEQWSKVMNVNLNTAFMLSQSVIQNALIKQKKLNVIHIASISGIQAEPNRAAYVTSKFGLIGLTKQLAFQYGKYNIRTNAIAPGILATPLTEGYFDDADLVKKIKHSTPVGHWGAVEHILPLVDICLTNDYMNGSVIVCDGGWTTGKDL